MDISILLYAALKMEMIAQIIVAGKAPACATNDLVVSAPCFNNCHVNRVLEMYVIISNFGAKWKLNAPYLSTQFGHRFLYHSRMTIL